MAQYAKEPLTTVDKLKHQILKVEYLQSKMAKSVDYMEEYLSNQFDEKLVMELLFSERKKDGLIYLDEHLRDGQTFMVVGDKTGLFKGFSSALSDGGQQVRIHCTRLIAKIIPQLGADIDIYMCIVLPEIVANIGSQSVTLQKESIQTLHLYMKHSLDVFQIFRVIAFNGMQNTDLRTREQVIHKFPTLLFSDFSKEDYLDIVYGLATNLIDITVDKEVIVQTVQKLTDFIGEAKFNAYVEQLPNTLKVLFTEQLSTILNKGEGSAHHVIRKSSEVQQDISVDSMHQHDHARSHIRNKLKSLPTVSHAFSDADFIPKEILVKLSLSELGIRLEGALALKHFVSDSSSPSQLKKTIIPLFSLLQPMIEDPNTQISLIALDIFDIIILKLGNSLSDYLKLFVFAVSKKFGSNKDAVRSSCNKVMLHAMGCVGPQAVLDLLWNKLQHKHAKVREDTINIIIATLLTFPLTSKQMEDINIEAICKNISVLLLDLKPVIRQACLDCFAVIAHLLGTNASSIKPISNAVDQVELQNDNANGVMSAVHARLIRKQLPRLTEHTLVEYAAFPPSTAPASSPQGADLQWILSAGALKQVRNSSKTERLPFRKKSLKSDESDMSNEHHIKAPRRYLSAGKQRQFPWSSMDYDSSAHPKSAPQKADDHERTEKRPPIVPKKMWGPEQTNKSFASSIKKKGLTPSKAEGTTYQELYMRKKGLNGRSPLLQMAQNPGNSSMYMPSFAPSDSTSGVSVLSSSCPSNFFQTHSAKRVQKLFKSDETSIIADDEDDTSYPIPLKPTLARSAAKRREKNVGLAEIHQQTNVTMDPIVKEQPTTVEKGTEKSRLFKNQLEDMQVARETVETSFETSKSEEMPDVYAASRTPSTMDKIKTFASFPGSNARSFENTPNESLSFGEELKQEPSLNHIPSQVQSDSEFLKQTTSIRRSAQNKRQAIRSQPSSASSHLSEMSTLEGRKSFGTEVLPAEVGTQSEKIMDKPFYSSLKYNPNMGVTFDSRNSAANVAVVGVGVKINQSNGHLSDGLLGSWHSSPVESPISSSSRSSIFSPPSEKNGKKQKALHSSSSTSSILSPTMSEDSFFNVQGKSVFSTLPASNEVVQVAKDIITSTSNSSFTTDEEARIGCVVGQSVSPKEAVTKQSRSPINKTSSQSSLHRNLDEKKQQKLRKIRRSTTGPAIATVLPNPSNISDFVESSSRVEDCVKATASISISDEKQSSAENSYKSGFVRLPLDNPEYSLGEAIKLMDASNPDDWERITSGIFLISRLAVFHPGIIGPRIHEVAIILSKHVHNLRSQVSKSSVIALSELFGNSKRSHLDVITEIAIRCLLTEYGKANSFMKEEIDKALHNIVTAAPPTKTLLSLLTIGQRHKNRAIRKTTAYFCSQVVEKMGAGKALSGIKDTTEKLMDAIASFIVDGTQEVRYYGRCIVNELMNHSDFSHCVDRCLPPKAAQEVKDCAVSIQQRGIGSSSSVGSRKYLGTRVSGSAPGAHRVSENLFQSTSAPPRRKISNHKRSFTDLDLEQIKVLCHDLSNGSSEERKNAVFSLLTKANDNPVLIGENLTKVMDAFGALLATANTKLNSVALEAIPKLLSLFGDGLKEPLSKLLPDIFKLLQSKANSEHALKTLDLILMKIDPAYLIQPVGRATLHGSTKPRQVAIGKLKDIVIKVGSRKPNVVEKQALPFLWSLLTTYLGPSAIQFKREIEQLTKTFYELFQNHLFDFAEAKGLVDVLQTILNSP